MSEWMIVGLLAGWFIGGPIIGAILMALPGPKQPAPSTDPFDICHPAYSPRIGRRIDI